MSAWRKCLLPLVPVYAAGLARKNARFDSGRARPRKLAWPVISIGGLSAGGAGKTPFVILLAQLLAEHGCAVDVLSRGYGRKGNRTERVEATGDAARFGDEPLLIARRAGVPVYVGSERYEAGLLAERAPQNEADRSKLRLHLLDDGFQHRRLARSVDMVLVTRRDLQDRLLPAGDLREPLQSLRRADILVAREEEGAEVEQAARRVLGDAMPVLWRVKRSVRISGQCNAQPSRPLAFSGLARPADFAESLSAAGLQPAETVEFRDHHRYTAEDMRSLVARAKAAGADSFATTEKDAVKLSAPMSAVLEAVGPLAIATLSLELIDAEAAMLALLQRVLR
ncbi:MAG: tetraacyldisaccharide 4'-kinase [Acidobacteriaceae bacterium]